MLIIALSAKANTHVGMELRKIVLPGQVFGNSAFQFA
jgi:hypothetical protein